MLLHVALKCCTDKIKIPTSDANISRTKNHLLNVRVKEMSHYNQQACNLTNSPLLYTFTNRYHQPLYEPADSSIVAAKLMFSSLRASIH